MPSTPTTATSRIFVATNATIPANLAAYKALTWTAIGSVEDIGGQFGDTFNKVEAKVYGTRRTIKAKGSVDGGALELKVLRDASDAGQTILRTALGSDDPIFVKIELGDKPATGASPTGSLAFFPGIVFSAPVEHGDADQFVKQTFNVEVVGQAIEAAPSATA